MRTRPTLELAATLASLVACHAPPVPASNGAVSTPATDTRAAEPGAIAPAAAPEAIRVAITFDDLPAHGPLLPNQTILDVHRQILGELGAHRVPAVYGFVNGYRLEQHAEGRRVLELWRDAGHPLGNHSWGHEDVGEVGVDAFVRSIDRNDGLLAELVGDSDGARQARRVFRYPYLRQGRDQATLDAVRAHLEQQHYRRAEVSIDFGDWAYNAPFVRCSAAQATDAVQALRWNYVRRGVEYLQWSVAAAQVIYGRAIAHVLLLHSGSFDAAVLDELLDAYEQQGVRWITLDEALADAAYHEDVRVPRRTGGTLLEQRIERDHAPAPPYHIQSDGLLEHVCREAPPAAATPP